MNRFKMKHFIQRLLSGLWAVMDDLFFLVGAGLIVYGLSRVDLVSAIIAAGGFCILAGVLIAIGKAKRGGGAGGEL